MFAEAPVRFSLSFARAHQHLVDVEASYPAPGDTLALVMPSWSPGSYMIREYARHVEGVTAHDEHQRPLAIDKTRKDTFVVQSNNSRCVTVRYAVYGREMTVRTNFICDEFALLQTTATLLGCAAYAEQPHAVHVALPAHWGSVHCGLKSQPSETTFVAQNFDELLDSPLLAGNPRRTAFEVDGVPHALITIGGDETYDNADAAADARRIVRQNVKMWGQIPYPQYWFLNVLLGGGGGLEHRHSSVLMGPGHARASAQGRADFAGLVAHEHFHAWNIKRLRPRALGPFDYSQENYTHSLWVAEGLTAYYDDLQACRAGLVEPSAYLTRLATSIEQLDNTPGRNEVSLSRASFDAWIKLYRADENTANTSVSYYLKGSLLGFVLDAKIRQCTGDTRSLDDAMRLAYTRYSGATGFTDAEFRRTVTEVAGGDATFAAWLDVAVDTPANLDYTPALSHYGLSLQWQPVGDGRPKHRDSANVLGAHLESATGNAIVAQVRRDSGAYRAGLNVGDEVIAIGDRRVSAEQLIERLMQAAEAGRRDASLLVCRFGRLRRIPVTLSAPGPRKATLSLAAVQTDPQQRARAAWLSPH